MASNTLADYSKTIIYKIQCKDLNIRDIYVGHTTCYYQRRRLHKSTCYNKNAKGYHFKIYRTIRENGGWEKWDMTILENYPCDNIYDARQRERYWIEELSSSLNVTIPNRNKDEYYQIYRSIFKEKISEKAKIYRKLNIEKIKKYIELHVEKIKEKKNEWYKENREKILEKAKDYYQEHKEDKLEYQKEYAEKNKDKIKDYQKDYREENKEQLCASKKIYRANNKEYASQKHKEWRDAHQEELKAKRAQVIN